MYIMGNGKMVKNMAKESSFEKMEVIIKAIGKIISLMDMED